VSDQNCDQSEGVAVCCAVSGCAGPCQCTLAAQCNPGNPGTVDACDGSSDCGDKVCCEATAAGQTQRICTPSSLCNGVILP
jgi:hypothetical protein